MKKLNHIKDANEHYHKEPKSIWNKFCTDKRKIIKNLGMLILVKEDGIC